MSIEKFLCLQDATIKDAMGIINENAKGIAFVIDDQKKIVGVVTDGDIRRTLLNEHDMQASIQKAMQSDFVYCIQGESIDEARTKFSEDVKVVPVVDVEMHVIDYMEYYPNLRVPLAQPELIGNEYKYLFDAFSSTWISSIGGYITRFEDSFSNYCGMRYGVATSNGTTALHLALMALGIGEGDEVIVPDITFAATINAVIYTGATPVIVDIEEDSWCIDPKEIQKAITNKTKAIIPVHIYGQPCDMNAIMEIAKTHNLYIVEDCAEAHGACFDGKKVGSFGVISCFSFFGNKVITTGEGGMCLTNDERLNQKMRILRDHGMSKERRYYHEVIGYNYRMTNLQAAIGTAQVERVDEILGWRNKLEIKYREILSSVKGIKLQALNLPKREKIAWLVSICVQKKYRDKIIEILKNNAIDARPFFIPLSEMDIYKKYAKECVVSKRISKEGINLPTTGTVSDEVIRKIRVLIEEVLK